MEANTEPRYSLIGIPPNGGEACIYGHGWTRAIAVEGAKVANRREKRKPASVRWTFFATEK